jgi:glycosyltransferase involved in cell wall biosynthesis
MARILILISGHLCNAPRPQKEADALAAAGHEVMIAGIWFDDKFVDRDRQLLSDKSWSFHPIVDFRGGTLAQKLQRLRMRLQAKLARELFQKMAIALPDLLGYGARAMLQFAKTYRADLTIVHSEAGLWVGQQLRQQGYTVGVDFEDWFSEDLLPSARASRPTAWIQALEADLARHCTYCLAPSQAMATAIALAYQSDPPVVIYNSFPRVENLPNNPQYHDRANLQHPSLHWFSQTIGPGRGLETLLTALPHLKATVDIHLRGNCPAVYRDWLNANIPDGWHDRIWIHDTVANHLLPARIAEHDIGLALETSAIPSRDLTVTNKLFQYLQAGLAVIATDTAGQREVLRHHSQAGQLIPTDDAIALATAINYWVQKPEQLARAKQAAAAASIALAWETQAPKLVRQAEIAMSLEHNSEKTAAQPGCDSLFQSSQTA